MVARNAEWKTRKRTEGKERMKNHLFSGGRGRVVCDGITRGSEVKNCQTENSYERGEEEADDFFRSYLPANRTGRKYDWIIIERFFAVTEMKTWVAFEISWKSRCPVNFDYFTLEGIPVFAVSCVHCVRKQVIPLIFKFGMYYYCFSQSYIK